MHKLIITLIATVTTIVLAGTGVASASTPTNYGQCHVLSPYDSALAPGQSGNGPMTQDANGVWHQPPAFAGWMACPKG